MRKYVYTHTIQTIHVLGQQCLILKYWQALRYRTEPLSTAKKVLFLTPENSYSSIAWKANSTRNLWTSERNWQSVIPKTAIDRHQGGLHSLWMAFGHFKGQPGPFSHAIIFGMALFSTAVPFTISRTSTNVQSHAQASKSKLMTEWWLWYREWPN